MDITEIGREKEGRRKEEGKDVDRKVSPPVVVAQIAEGNVKLAILGFLSPRHGASPRLRGIGLQWRLATNILNKPSWKPTRSGPPALVFGVRLTISHCKKSSSFRNVTQGLGRALVNAALNLRVP